jgi:hypothetical protein
MYVLLGFLYVMVWAVMSVDLESADDRLTRLAVMYHVVHPDGRGADVAELVANRETIEQCFRRLPSRNALILCEVYERLRDMLRVMFLVHGIDPPLNEFFLTQLIDHCVLDFALVIRQPRDDCSAKILAETMTHVENWQPTPEQQDMFDLLSDWKSE